MILYGGTRGDSIKAYTFKHLIEQDSFQVVYMERIVKDTSQQVLNYFRETMEVDIEMVDMDSLSEEDIERGKVDVPVLERDSIGSVYVASESKLLASSVVSAMEAREDTIQIVGSAKWLEYRFVDYEAYERLGIVLTASNPIKMDAEIRNSLSQAYISRYGTPPSSYFF